MTALALLGGAESHRPTRSDQAKVSVHKASLLAHREDTSSNASAHLSHPFLPPPGRRWLHKRNEPQDVSPQLRGNSSGVEGKPYQQQLHRVQATDMASRPETGGLPMIMALVGGTGASLHTGRREIDRDLLRRMHYQDKAVMVLVLVVYFVALLFSANLTYRQATNSSPVTYYADQRFHECVSEGNDVEAFLQAFNQMPKSIHLQVSGFLRVQDEEEREEQRSVSWRGEPYQVAFTFALDLTPWVSRSQSRSQEDGEAPDGGRTSGAALPAAFEGVSPQDLSKLSHYLNRDANDLSSVELRKQVSWSDWEELATNIKHQIRQHGFRGVISVHRAEEEVMLVYKNRPWANFMHSRTTRMLCALSVIGYLFYVPYMWLRCTQITICPEYRVDVNIRDYWPLIRDKLTAEGFQDQLNGRGARVAGVGRL